MGRLRAAILLVAALPILSGCALLGGDVFPLSGRGSAGGDEASAPLAGAEALHLGMTGLAVGHFEAAVAQDPSSASAWNGLGAAYDGLGRRDLARRAYARALSLAPASAETLNNMGASYHADGRYDLAVSMLRGASARDGAHPVIAANRNAAELALAAVGGPRPRTTPRPRAPAEPRGPFKPRIERTGRGELTLLTRPLPQLVAPQPSAVVRPIAPAPAEEPASGSVMPDYLAAPLALAHPLPVTGAARVALGGSARP